MAWHTSAVPTLLRQEGKQRQEKLTGQLAWSVPHSSSNKRDSASIRREVRTDLYTQTLACICSPPPHSNSKCIRDLKLDPKLLEESIGKALHDTDTGKDLLKMDSSNTGSNPKNWQVKLKGFCTADE